MATRSFILSLALVLMLAIAVGSVEARAKPFHASFVGSSTNKDDFSFTGTPGASSYNVFAGKGTLGPYTGQLVAELPLDGKTCLLPGGGSGLEFVFVGEAVVLSFAASDAQLFFHLSPSVTSHACFDPTTGVTTGQTTFDVSGGTGRFAGATGTIIKTWKFIFLAPASPPGKGIFGSFTGTFDGTITLPRGGEDGQGDE